MLAIKATTQMMLKATTQMMLAIKATTQMMLAVSPKYNPKYNVSNVYIICFF
jgi:hypothetical protein